MEIFNWIIRILAVGALIALIVWFIKNRGGEQ